MGKDKVEPFKPRGGNLAFFCCRDAEVLNCGVAGSGKSFTALKKLDFLCTKYAGSRALIARKTRASLTESALVTFENDVLPKGSAVLADHLQRKTRSVYKYPNGSEVIVGGLDDPTKIMSTEFNFIYLQEAVEILSTDYEALVSRNRYRGTPYNQLLADTNPSHARHWLRKRSMTERVGYDGKPTGKPLVTLINTTLKDNPRFWDEANRSWTEDGMQYLAKMQNLTGTMRKRLLDGEWVSSEGIVYPEFDAEIHVIKRSQMPVIPGHWQRYIGIDFGYQSPFVTLWFALDPQSKALYCYREWYQTAWTVPEHAKKIKFLHGNDPTPTAIICDHDLDGRMTLEQCNGWVTIPAKKNKQDALGIQEVRDRLTPDAKGNCGLYFMEDMLVDYDKAWGDLGNPVGTIEEFGAYAYSPRRDRVSDKEVPMDKWDHGMDVLSYICLHLANHYGEWKGFKSLPATPEPMVLAQDPVGDGGRRWFPYPRLGISGPDGRRV